MEELRYNADITVFNFPLFKKLLVDTWQYFIDTVGDSGILAWEYDAYVKILEGLLLSLQEPEFPRGYNGNFHNGYITVEEYTHREYAFHISEFESYLQELAQMYYEVYYSDTYDENGKEWEEDTADE